MDIKELTKRTQTRHLKRTNTLKSSNFSMNLDTLEARSYGWWVFVKKANDKVIFNNTTYSSSTCKHQSKAFRVLNYEADLVLRFTKASLSNLENALDSEIRGVKLEIQSIIRDIRKPRSHKAKNLERKNEISKLLKHINKVRLIKSEVSND